MSRDDDDVSIKSYPTSDVLSLPDSLDWKEKGIVTEVGLTYEANPINCVNIYELDLNIEINIRIKHTQIANR